jgi:Na+/H+-dicarboxylate symporter
LGALAPQLGVHARILADLFVDLVRVMVIPIVFCTSITGISGVPGNRNIGKTLLKSVTLYYGLTALALIVGVAAAVLIHPGAMSDALSGGLRHSSPLMPDGADSQDALHSPVQWIAPFAKGGILPTLLVAFLLGVSIRTAGPSGQPVRELISALGRILFIAFGLVMRLAPIGAFGAMAYLVSANGINSIGSLAMFLISMYAASIFFIFGVVWTIAGLSGINFLRLLRYFREELLLVLSTSSSETVLPAVMVKLEALGCAKSSVGITVPLGFSFNLTGTAIYIALSTIFLAQIKHVHIPTSHYFLLAFAMLIAAKTAVGFAGSGFVALTTVLTASHDTTLLAATVIIGGIDQFQSRARAMTSLVTNLVSSIVLAKWEGLCDVKIMKSALTRGSTETFSVSHIQPR